MGVLNAGHRGAGGQGAGGEDDAVSPEGADVVGGDGGVEPHVDVPALHLTDQQVLKVHQVGLVGVHIGEPEQTAQVTSGLGQNHLLAPVAGGDGGLHTGGAAAHDEDGLLLGGGSQGVGVEGQVGQGVDGAVAHVEGQLLAGEGQIVVALLGGAGEALVAAQAAADLILMAALGLVGKLRVGQHLAAQDHEVHLALGNGLLAQLGGVDAAHGAHGQLGVPLDDGGVVDVQAVGVEHGALGARLDGLLIDAAGHMDGGDVGLGHGDEFAGLLGGDAAGLVVGAVNAQLHQEVGAHRLPDGLQNLEGEPGPILQRAAVVVGTGVHQGGEELGEDKAVAAVDEHAVKAGLLHIGGGDGEVMGHPGHVVLVHGPDFYARQVGGLDGADGLLTGAEGHLLLAAVDQLGQGHGAVALDAAGVLAHGVKGLGVLLRLGEVEGTEAGDTDGVGEVDVGLAHDDAAVAALGAGLQLAVSEVPGGGVLNDEAEGHGGADNTVAVGHLAHLHGGKQMLKFHGNRTPFVKCRETGCSCT